MARQKELHFFDRHFNRGPDWYADQFDSPREERIRGEATPAYLSNRLAISRMSRLIPEARIIVNLREPIDRLHSHYWMRFERKTETRSIEDAIRQELDAYERAGIESDELTYLKDSLYVFHLKRLHSVFDQPNTHVIIFEHMKRDPVSIYQSVCRFLQVEDSVVPAIVGETINPYVRFRSLRVRNWSKRTRYRRTARLISRLNTRFNVGYPDIPQALMEELIEFFEPHNRALFDLLGEPIPEWQRTLSEKRG